MTPDPTLLEARRQLFSLLTTGHLGDPQPRTGPPWYVWSASDMPVAALQQLAAAAAMPVTLYTLDLTSGVVTQTLLAPEACVRPPARDLPTQAPP